MVVDIIKYLVNFVCYKFERRNKKCFYKYYDKVFFFFFFYVEIKKN